MCETMKFSSPYKIKFYAGAKYHGKLQTTFWDVCFHKSTFRHWTRGRKVIFYTNTKMPETPCKHCSLRWALPGMSVSYLEHWLIHTIMPFFLARVWTYCSFFQRGINQAGRGCCDSGEEEKQRERNSPFSLSGVGHSAVRNLGNK